MNGFTRSAAFEVAAQGIRVNAVAHLDLVPADWETEIARLTDLADRPPTSTKEEQ